MLNLVWLFEDDSIGNLLFSLVFEELTGYFDTVLTDKVDWQGNIQIS